jgi:hypothetical protein
MLAPSVQSAKAQRSLRQRSAVQFIPCKLLTSFALAGSAALHLSHGASSFSRTFRLVFHPRTKKVVAWYLRGNLGKSSHPIDRKVSIVHQSTPSSITRVRKDEILRGVPLSTAAPHAECGASNVIGFWYCTRRHFLIVAHSDHLETLQICIRVRQKWAQYQLTQ